MTLDEQMQLEARYMMRTYGRKQAQFVRGDGMRLYDDKGMPYLDFLAGIGAVSLGHCHPAVASAVSEQAGRLMHVGNYYYVEGRGELAEKISALLNRTAGADAGTQCDEGKEGKEGAVRQEAWRTFFANSGAEANEGAIKLARKYGNTRLGGATVVITATNSFHGRTLATTAATGQQIKQESFSPMPSGFAHVPINDEAALEDAIRAGRQAGGSDAPCAVLLECIQGEGGVWPCHGDYLRAARALTQRYGLLLMIDEVQTGFYRTGGAPFAFQHAGILPDVVAMAKGLGGGFPIGAFAAYGDYGDILAPGEHGSTFGGNPLAVAAANAVIDVLNGEGFASNVATTGAYFMQELRGLPLVAEARGAGLMLAAQLSSPIATAVVDAALAKGLVINAIGDDILRFLPPLICEARHVDEAVAVLRAVLEEAAS
jgi:acetylornithine aminotransferase